MANSKREGSQGTVRVSDVDAVNTGRCFEPRDRFELSNPEKQLPFTNRYGGSNEGLLEASSTRGDKTDTDVCCSVISVGGKNGTRGVPCANLLRDECLEAALMHDCDVGAGHPASYREYMPADNT
jgi:hypothetical protein